MTDIATELDNTIKEIRYGHRNVMGGNELYLLLVDSLNEIEKLRKQVTDMGWQLNPDRMGGQFTDEELGRDGWL